MRLLWGGGQDLGLRGSSNACRAEWLLLPLGVGCQGLTSPCLWLPTLPKAPRQGREPMGDEVTLVCGCPEPQPRNPWGEALGLAPLQWKM